MPGGMAAGADAEAIADYIAGGLKGEAPAMFAVCVVCHGADGKGNNGMTPDLTKFTSRINKMSEECNKGNKEACYKLGQAYENGTDGVETNKFKATDFFIQGCEKGHGWSCFLTAGKYLDGESVRVNMRLAKEYFGKACDLHLEEGCRMYKEMSFR